MVEDAQKQQTIFPNAKENYISWSNQGTPTQLQNNKINNIMSEHHQKQDRWEELGGPNYSIMAPGKTFNMPQYPVLNEGKLSPGWLEAGIPATNQGYKVMNAGLFDDPTADGGWIDRLSRWIFGDNDPENDYLGPPLDDTIDEGDYYDPNNPNHFMVPEENPPYDPNNPNHFMVPEGMDPELFEPGIENLQAGMDDSLQSLQYDIDQLDPDSPNYDDMLELLNSDIGMKYPWAQQALNLQDVIDLYESKGIPLNTDRFMRRANKAGVQMTNHGGIIGLI